MTTGGMMLDTREFDRALIQYAAASKKDFKDITNKRVYDSALRAVKHADRAKKSAINKLAKEKNLVWWFAHKVYIPRGWKKNHAYEEAEKMLRARGRAISFVRSFFVKMASIMAPRLNPPTGVRGRGKGSFAGFTPIVIPATNERPIATLGMQYDYDKRSQATAKKTENLLMHALRGGIRDATADMMVYVNRKMGKTAKKYSARRVA